MLKLTQESDTINHKMEKSSKLPTALTFKTKT